MAVLNPKPAEIRAAKSWLERRGITTEELSPRTFAKAAKELDRGFAETARYLAGADDEDNSGYDSGAVRED